MNTGFKKREITLAEQAASIKAKFPQFQVSSNHQTLKVIGYLKPTSRSISYKFELTYDLRNNPRIRVISPSLQKNSKGEDIPHMYSQKRLCLFHPLYGEFRRSDFISETIIMWAGLWLYHYENWHLTGKWMGGGEHPSIKAF